MAQSLPPQAVSGYINPFAGILFLLQAVLSNNPSIFINNRAIHQIRQWRNSNMAYFLMCS